MMIIRAATVEISKGAALAIFSAEK